MKTLIIDIETSPNLGYVFGLWNQNLSPEKVLDFTQMLCFAAKWHGEKNVKFHSYWDDGQEGMAAAAHRLLDQADSVVHFNGRRFDIPHLNREILLAGMAPPSPYAQVDLYAAIKRVFKFESNKLSHIAKQLGVEEKSEHRKFPGFELWLQVMAGNPEARKEMRKYNVQDVKTTEQVYDRLIPWIPGLPSHSAFDGSDVCPACGGDRLERRGFSLTRTGQYQRYLCLACGRWSRATVRSSGTKVVAA